MESIPEGTKPDTITDPEDLIETSDNNLADTSRNRILIRNDIRSSLPERITITSNDTSNEISYDDNDVADVIQSSDVDASRAAHYSIEDMSSATQKCDENESKVIQDSDCNTNVNEQSANTSTEGETGEECEEEEEDLLDELIEGPVVTIPDSYVSPGRSRRSLMQRLSLQRASSDPSAKQGILQSPLSFPKLRRYASHRTMIPTAEVVGTLPPLAQYKIEHVRNFAERPSDMIFDNDNDDDNINIDLSTEEEISNAPPIVMIPTGGETHSHSISPRNRSRKSMRQWTSERWNSNRSLTRTPEHHKSGLASMSSPIITAPAAATPDSDNFKSAFAPFDNASTVSPAAIYEMDGNIIKYRPTPTSGDRTPIPGSVDHINTNNGSLSAHAQAQAHARIIPSSSSGLNYRRSAHSPFVVAERDEDEIPEMDNNMDDSSIPYAVFVTALPHLDEAALDVTIPSRYKKSPFRDKRVLSFLLFAVICIFGLGYGFIVQNKKLKENDIEQNFALDISGRAGFSGDSADSADIVSGSALDPCDDDIDGEGCTSISIMDEETTDMNSPPSSSDLASSVDVAGLGVSSFFTPTPVDVDSTISSAEDLEPSPAPSEMKFTPGSISTPLGLKADQLNFVDGCMFNVHVGDAALKLVSMDILLDDTSGEEVEIEVWTKRGTYVGHESSELWESVFGDDSVYVIGNGPTEFTHLKRGFFNGFGTKNFFLQKNQVRAFYVTVKSNSTHHKNIMISGNGEREGQVYLSDNHVSITDGTCFGYPFNIDNSPLVPMRWFGSLNYDGIGLLKSIKSLPLKSSVLKSLPKPFP